MIKLNVNKRENTNDVEIDSFKVFWEIEMKEILKRCIVDETISVGYLENDENYKATIIALHNIVKNICCFDKSLLNDKITRNDVAQLKLDIKKLRRVVNTPEI